MHYPAEAFRHQIPARAFSLIEILVVIGFTAILLGFSLPAISSMRTAGGFTNDIQQVSDVLAFARSHAMAKGRPVDVGIRSVNDGLVLVVGEREASGFHPIARSRILERARLEAFTPASELPAIEDPRNGTITQIIRFNSRGEARVRPDGVDREVAIELLPNVDGRTPEALRANRAEIVVHGLSGGVSLIRNGAATP